MQPRSAPPGWYLSQTPDVMPGTLQWWDGTKWTGQYAPPAPHARTAPQVAPYGPLIPQRSVGAAYAFLLLLGGIGAHRFYLGMPWTATTLLLLWIGTWALIPVHGELIPLAVLVVWLIVDLCVLPGLVADANLRAVTKQITPRASNR
ncbi:NINE protein [Microbacterium mangrovi]|uniref:NINE protein n=1 Tax=Microbacterium mangrovi TaxID=1348253 RepID=UPI0038B29F33